MKRIVLIILTLVLLFYLLPETKLNAAGIQEGPTGPIGSEGNRLVWSAYVDGNSEIYMYDQNTQAETRLTNHPATQGYPSIYGDYVVWQDDRNDEGQSIKSFDIYSYNLLAKEEKKISQTAGNHEEPKIYKNYVVWRNTSGGKSDVILYDLNTSVQRSLRTTFKRSVWKSMKI